MGKWVLEETLRARKHSAETLYNSASSDRRGQRAYEPRSLGIPTDFYPIYAERLEQPPSNGTNSSK